METKARRRKKVGHVWVAECAYRESRWLTLWSTCRLYKQDCRIALEAHPSFGEWAVTRIVKFVRGAKP